MKTLEERFWEKVDKSSGCWEWTGGHIQDGYGLFGIDGKTYLVHRVSWELHNGPIPEGFFICHHCDNPSCVNPAHLFLGTQKDNIQDAMKKDRMFSALGEKNGQSKLTEDDIREIRADGGKTLQRVLAKKHKVNRSLISHILSGKIWKHVKDTV